MPSPTISVLIAARNRRQFLEECIRSLHAQTFRGFEIILVDDGSSDGTAELAAEVTRYQWTRPRGVAHARNVALGLAQGDFLYVLDSDDYLLPNALADSLFTIENFQADMVFSDLLILRGEKIVGCLRTAEQTVEEVLMVKRVPHGSSLFRRAGFNLKYNEALQSAEDLDLLLRYLPGKAIKKLASPVYVYRQHEGNESGKPIQGRVAKYVRQVYAWIHRRETLATPEKCWLYEKASSVGSLLIIEPGGLLFGGYAREERWAWGGVADPSSASEPGCHATFPEARTGTDESGDLLPEMVFFHNVDDCAAFGPALTWWVQQGARFIAGDRYADSNAADVIREYLGWAPKNPFGAIWSVEVPPVWQSAVSALE